MTVIKRAEEEPKIPKVNDFFEFKDCNSNLISGLAIDMSIAKYLNHIRNTNTPDGIKNLISENPNAFVYVDLHTGEINYDNGKSKYFISKETEVILHR
jgi:hypothetical protein